MSLFSKSGSLVRNTMHKRQIDRELTEEVSSYIELLTEKKMKEGTSASASAMFNMLNLKE